MVSNFENGRKLMMDRARVYSFLSRIYREELDEEFLIGMKQGFRSVDCEEPELRHAYGNLHMFLNRIEIDDELVTGLASDYADLFLGIGKHPAHPYESVYRGRNGTVMGIPRDEVIGFYRKESLRRAEWFKEPEDHVAIVLEFMAYLCLKEKETLEIRPAVRDRQWIRLQLDFLEQHLKNWVPAFCNDILKCPTRYEFYDGIAEFTKAYIIFEEKTLCRLIAVDDTHRPR